MIRFVNSQKLITKKHDHTKTLPKIQASAKEN